MCHPTSALHSPYVQCVQEYQGRPASIAPAASTTAAAPQLLPAAAAAAAAGGHPQGMHLHRQQEQEEGEAGSITFKLLMKRGGKDDKTRELQVGGVLGAVCALVGWDAGDGWEGGWAGL